MLRTVLFVATTVALTACGGDAQSPQEGQRTVATTSSGSSSRCAAITGGQTTVGNGASTCATCTTNNSGNAIDGNFGTAATMTVPSGTGSGNASLRATAQDGVVYPAGSNAGALVRYAAIGSSFSQSETLTTYLGGVVQETRVVGSINGVRTDNTPPNSAPSRRVSLQALLPFDAVEYSFIRSGGTATVTLDVFEFCND